MSELQLLENIEIKDRIFSIRGLQVMLDSDLADLYGVETKTLNRNVKRNSNRFPQEFMFQLSKQEWDKLKYQFGASSIGHGGRRNTPNVFTEQGVTMLSSVLHSKKAVEISIIIVNTFVKMRHYLSQNETIINRFERIEMRLNQSDDRFEKVFNALEDKNKKPTQGIFYNGQIFDAYLFTSDLIKCAKSSIILIDNYIDETVLQQLSKKQKSVKVKIYTSKISKELELDAKKFNQQYGSLELIKFDKSHDRFLILDDEQVYFIGASLKDLGKKIFAFSKMESQAEKILQIIR